MAYWAREVSGQLDRFTLAAENAVRSNEEVVDQIRKLRKVIKQMSIDLSHITTSVAGIESAVSSAISLLAQLSAKISELQNQPDEATLRAAIDDLAGSLDAKKDDLAQAILVSTPSDPNAPPVAPPVDTPPVPEPAPIPEPEPPLEPVPDPVPDPAVDPLFPVEEDPKPAS